MVEEAVKQLTFLIETSVFPAQLISEKDDVNEDQVAS